MAYVTQTEFEAYTNTTIDSEDFDILAERASEIIDYVTIYKITNNDLSVYDTFIQNQVKKATNAQIEFLYLNGGVAESYTGNDSLNSGFTVGKFTINSAKQSEAANVEYIRGMPIAPFVKMYLAPTGLLYAGIGGRYAVNSY